MVVPLIVKLPVTVKFCPIVASPPTAKLDNVPTEVIDGCAAVVTVPAVVAVAAFPVILPTIAEENVFAPAIVSLPDS